LEKRGKTHIIKLLLACTLSSGVLCLAISHFFHSKTTGCGQLGSFPSKKTIQYSFTLYNRTNRLIKNAKFWTYAPVRRTASQVCGTIEASHPFHLIQDDFGNQVMCFSFDEIPPFTTRIITIKAALSMADSPNCINSPLKRYLFPEPLVESETPQIRELAKKLAGDSPRSTVDHLYRWVADHIHYSGYRSNEKGALETLRSKTGDCSEFMRLFVALCRASAIPARSVGGYVCQGNRIVHPVEYHNWAEFYMAGTWHLSDPQKKKYLKHSADYIAMHIIAEPSNDAMQGVRRFRFEGRGLEAKMNS
jgi:transglutaminase-like putative cysteine protease